MSEILVVANETLGGRRLRDVLTQKARTNPSLLVRLVIPQSRPRRGSVIYLESVRAVAEVRLALALSVLREDGFDVTGEIGDSDPFSATMDAIGERKPDEIIISTLPAVASGWLRRDLVERVADASGIPVQHVISELDEDSDPPTDTTLVVANRTAASPELTARLRELAGEGGGADGHLFIVVVPQIGTDGAASSAAHAHLDEVLDRLREAGLTVAGLVGDPDPFTATMNALQFFRVSRVVISTLPETKSGWLRADLIERVRRYAACPVEHVVAISSDAVAAN
jgi:hypothetical protein